MSIELTEQNLAAESEALSGTSGVLAGVPPWAVHWRKHEPKMCPFCGSHAGVVVKPDVTDSIGRPTEACRAYVCCSWCPCRTASLSGDDAAEAKGRALAVWNGRKYATREWGDDPAP